MANRSLQTNIIIIFFFIIEINFVRRPNDLIIIIIAHCTPLLNALSDCVLFVCVLNAHCAFLLCLQKEILARSFLFYIL